MQQRARLAGHRVRRDHAWLALDGTLDRPAGHLALAIQIDERFGVPAERRRVDDCGVAEDYAVALESVHAALDRRRREVHVTADVLERAPRVLAQQRND